MRVRILPRRPGFMSSCLMFLGGCSARRAAARRETGAARLRRLLGDEFLRLVLPAGAGTFAAGAASPRRLPAGHETVLAGADEVGSSHAFQRLAQDRPVLRVVIAQEGLVEAP